MTKKTLKLKENYFEMKESLKLLHSLLYKQTSGLRWQSICNDISQTAEKEGMHRELGNKYIDRAYQRMGTRLRY